MQALSQAGVARTFTLAGAGVVGTTEDREEITLLVEAVVREHGGSRASGKTTETSAHLGQVIDRIKQYLGLQTLRIVSREVVLVLGVVSVGDGTELIGLRSAKVTNYALHVETAFDELFGQSLKEFGIHRGIGLAHIVLGVHQASTEEMLPITIHERMGEKWIILGGHPIHERLPRVVVGGNNRGLRPKTRRLNGRIVFLVGGFRYAALVIYDVLIRQTALGPAHLGKEGGQLVIIFLTPLFKGVMMALGALNSRTEKKLGGILELVLHRLHFPVPSDGRVVNHFTGGSHHFSDELVVRLVLVQAVANPCVESVITSLVGSLGALVSEKGRPFVGKEVRVIGAGQQSVDQLVALVLILIGKKGLGFLRSRQTTTDIDRYSTNEGGIVADFGWRHAHGLELGENELVDIVASRRKVVHGSTERHNSPKHGHLVLVPNHHAQVTGLLEYADVSVLVHFTHFLVVRFVDGGTSDVLHAAVRVFGGNHELLFTFHVHDANLGEHGDALERRIIRFSVRHSLGYPRMDESIVERALFNPSASAMRGVVGRFRKQQATVRSGGKYTTSSSFLHDVFVILVRFETKKRKAKTILTTRLPVATTTVAAILAEQGCNLVGKIDALNRARLLHSYLSGGDGSTLCRNGDLSFSVLNRTHPTRLVYGHNARRFGNILNLARKVSLISIRENTRNDQLSASVYALQGKRVSVEGGKAEFNFLGFAKVGGIYESGSDKKGNRF